MMFCLPIYHQTDFNLSSNGLQSIIKRTSKHHRLKTKTSSNGIHSCYPSDIEIQSLNVSFTWRNSIIYDTEVARLRMHDCRAPSLNREGGGGSPPPLGRGWGGVAVSLTLHLNTLPSNKLHRTVKFFYLLQLFIDTISTHSEMYHHSVLIKQCFLCVSAYFILCQCLLCVFLCC